MNLMKIMMITAALTFLAAPAAVGATETDQYVKPVIIAAASTSASEGSSPITCLLDPGCDGYWSPAALDAGSNEGVYLRFKEPVFFKFIEITVDRELPDSLIFQTYLDARTTPRLDSQPEPDQPEEEDEPYNIITTRLVDQNPENGGYIYLVSSYDETVLPLNYTAMSVFIKLSPTGYEAAGDRPPQITAIRFFDRHIDTTGDTPHPEPMILDLPRSMPARAQATSTLEPVFAYDVSKLFDSQPDMAWSTDGKAGIGIGEKITVSFPAEQDIRGLMLWNGYQRSDMHYKANGRVKSLKVAGREVKIKDEQGPQVVRLAKPVKARDIELEITGIYSGGSYKDVLISELRFLGANDEVILPMVSAPLPVAPASLVNYLNTTFVPLFNEAWYMEPEDYMTDENSLSYQSSARLRDNGSFVIYVEDYSSRRDSIVEGGWEPQADGSIRLFGKKYQTAVWASNFDTYLREEAAPAEADETPPPRIFQSVMHIGRFHDFDSEEQEKAVRFILQNRLMPTENNDSGFPAQAEEFRPHAIATKLLTHGNEGDLLALGGPDLETAVENIIASLKEIDPMYVKSDVYTEILIPRNSILK
ncbi:hypothetical protein C4J81_00210 [Deltaproteobacteria bacterium Smac51]|nr:hypothetical protein C4J81_00210 [Deltaproteobacteria bacterium Smac51]